MSGQNSDNAGMNELKDALPAGWLAAWERYASPPSIRHLGFSTTSMACKVMIAKVEG